MIIEYTVRADSPDKLSGIAHEFAYSVAKQCEGDNLGTVHSMPWTPASPVSFIAAGTVGTGGKNATKWEATFRAAWGADVDYQMGTPSDRPANAVIVVEAGGE